MHHSNKERCRAGRGRYIQTDTRQSISQSPPRPRPPGPARPIQLRPRCHMRWAWPSGSVLHAPRRYHALHAPRTTLSIRSTRLTRAVCVSTGGRVESLESPQREHLAHTRHTGHTHTSPAQPVLSTRSRGSAAGRVRSQRVHAASPVVGDGGRAACHRMRWRWGNV